MGQRPSPLHSGPFGHRMALGEAYRVGSPVLARRRLMPPVGMDETLMGSEQDLKNLEAWLMPGLSIGCQTLLGGA